MKDYHKSSATENPLWFEFIDMIDFTYNPHHFAWEGLRFYFSHNEIKWKFPHISHVFVNGRHRALACVVDRLTSHDRFHHPSRRRDILCRRQSAYLEHAFTNTNMCTPMRECTTRYYHEFSRPRFSHHHRTNFRFERAHLGACIHFWLVCMGFVMMIVSNLLVAWCFTIQWVLNI